MQQIKTKFIIAITNQLAAAADSDAKVDLIDELSENLYQNYLDLVADGMDSQAAYKKAWSNLGNVEELLDYLDGCQENRQPQDSSDSHSFTDTLTKGIDDFSKGVEEVVRSAWSTARNAVSQTKKKQENVQQQSSSPVSMCSEEITAIDLRMIHGDIELCVAEDSAHPILITGATSTLDVQTLPHGTLAIRQNNTASSSFFFLRGLISSDIQLTLPGRCFKKLNIQTRNGDIEISDHLEAEELTIHTTNGDVKLYNNSGWIRSADISSVNGDLELKGVFERFQGSCTNGDIILAAPVLPRKLSLQTTSGDCTAILPEGIGFSLQYKNVCGDFSSEFPLATSPASPKRGRIYLDGGERSFTISSTMGDIALKIYHN